MWSVSDDSLNPGKLQHSETIFTIGNGYLSTRGAFEEGYPGEQRATFVHGVFDAAPVVFTELANAPDWLPLSVYLNDERFSLEHGQILDFQRRLDLRTGVLTRAVRWRSPNGLEATLRFERFASLDSEHLLLIRCTVVPEFEGIVEFRGSLSGAMDNEGLAHWRWLGQGRKNNAVYLRNRTRQSGIEIVNAMRMRLARGETIRDEWCDVDNAPTWMISTRAKRGEAIRVEKIVGVFTSRDAPATELAERAVELVDECAGWEAAAEANAAAWAKEWNRADVIIEGDEEAQIAIRFSLFHLLIAAPRHDDRVNIGAKTLSGFGYRGHTFWDTDIYILPYFSYTSPHIARNLLNYRYRNLAGAQRKAAENGYEGAQYPWESADDGDEVTPRWVPDFADPTRMVRIWTGDIEIHISADIAYAVHQFWKITKDDEWMIQRGAELILNTAKYFASRAEWREDRQHYEYNDVIGPDEYHEHVNNNAYTNRMAQWNIDTALRILEWLQKIAPGKAAELSEELDLNPVRLEKWKHVARKIYLPYGADGLIEQFDGYFQRQDVDLQALEPRSISAQVYYGIEGCNQTQVLKQPDVLMLLYLLREDYSKQELEVNYHYYEPRTDHTYGSSLGPSIMAIMASWMGRADDAYKHFIRAVRADLRDVRGNAGDGIHAASAGGVWQAVVFGFAGLRIAADGWTVNPCLPKHWQRVAFRFSLDGEMQQVDLQQ
jgi:kojibiose phosphorylase